MPYTRAVILELTRITNGPLGVPHETVCDTEVQGFAIPKGTTVS